jgi:hypothetical protein
MSEENDQKTTVLDINLLKLQLKKEAEENLKLSQEIEFQATTQLTKIPLLVVFDPSTNQGFKKVFEALTSIDIEFLSDVTKLSGQLRSSQTSTALFLLDHPAMLKLVPQIKAKFPLTQIILCMPKKSTSHREETKEHIDFFVTLPLSEKSIREVIEKIKTENK